MKFDMKFVRPLPSSHVRQYEKFGRVGWIRLSKNEKYVQLAKGQVYPVSFLSYLATNPHYPKPKTAREANLFAAYKWNEITNEHWNEMEQRRLALRRKIKNKHNKKKEARQKRKRSYAWQTAKMFSHW